MTPEQLAQLEATLRADDPNLSDELLALILERARSLEIVTTPTMMRIDDDDSIAARS